MNCNYNYTQYLQILIIVTRFDRDSSIRGDK